MSPSGIIQAQACSRPPWAKPLRGRGAKAAGRTYEKALAHALPGAKQGQWWHYTTTTGSHWCQTDVLLATTDDEIVILEAKLTLTARAFEQIERLYKPVVAKATKRAVLGVVVCKNLVKRSEMATILGRTPPICDNLTDALAMSMYCTPVLHWLGRSPLLSHG